MQITDLTVEVRNANFERVGQITAEYLVGFTAVLRDKQIGSWSIPLPVGNTMAELLREPGAGIIVSTAQGTLLSGPTTAVIVNQETADPEGTYEISGVTDMTVLDERLAYPTPTTADVTAQTTPYDIRNGVAETVIKEYVDANIGPSAPLARRIDGFTIEVDQARGNTVNGSARFDNLLELITGLADVGEVSFNVEQVGNGLQFQVTTATDRSATIRLDIYNGKLTRSEYAYSQPLSTRAIVGGAGTDATRVFLEHSTADSLDAENVWGRRIETFIDSSNTFVEAELQASADEVLVKDGRTQVSASVSPTDDETMLFGVDWNLGDKVTVVIGSLELVAVVTEVGILISADGVRIGATVGEPKKLDYETQILSRQNNQAVRISKLERTK
jgi:hypothetical protein